MRILYVSQEAPFFPAGGIATYLSYMAPAMAALGHEVFIFSWSDDKSSQKILDVSPFKPENVHIEPINHDEVWRVWPVDSHNQMLASWLAPRIMEKIREWGIDVIEATDFLAPALTLFQEIQSSADSKDVLCTTYNHGFIEDFFEADQLRLPSDARFNHLNERQQCRVSDLVVAPSQASRQRLVSYGIVDDVEVVREPYVFANEEEFRRLRHEIQYIGRISISKGIDKLIYLANVLNPLMPLRRIQLIGRIVDTPFRTNEMREYVTKRLVPELRERLFFTGYLPRESALSLLEPGAICPSLGSAETFSYACVESIDHNLIPIVRHGTPMEEFVPPEYQHFVLDEQMRSVSDLQKQLEKVVDEAPEYLAATRAYCQETLKPESVASQMTETYETAHAAKTGKVSIRVKAPATVDDVTILIPAHKPNEEFAEMVDSLTWQTAGIPKVLICNDGTPDGSQEWFDYARACIPDCEIVNQPNAGLLGARNTLVEHCKTRLALFLDVDDLLAPKALERLLEAWNGHPKEPDAVLPQRQNFGESHEPILRDLMDDHLHLLENDFRMTSLIRVDVLREIGFDSTRRNGEGDDWIFWLEFTGRGYKAVTVPRLDFWYRFRKGSMSWPWSTGQHVGTQTMVRQALIEMCNRNPQQAGKLARALYSTTVQR